MEIVTGLNGHHSCRFIDSKHWEQVDDRVGAPAYRIHQLGICQRLKIIQELIDNVQEEHNGNSNQPEWTPQLSLH